MKNLMKVALLATGLFAAAQTQAQTHRDTTLGQKIDKTTKKVGHATTKTAKKVGNETAEAATAVGHKTSELAAKGAAAVVDKKYDGKAGPHNENIYIDSKSRYYYVNKSGHRVYVTKAELKTKVED
ncbi:MAG: hypothetical protein ABI367_02070 [Mucilaginibacter sp.]